jgi:hypothetical protein
MGMVQLLNQRSQDQRIVQSKRSGEQFKLIQQGFDNASGVRLFCYDGTLEILMPGREHERNLNLLTRCVLLALTS